MTTTTSDLGEKVMARLRVIEGFASILMENDSLKGMRRPGSLLNSIISANPPSMKRCTCWLTRRRASCFN